MTVFHLLATSLILLTATVLGFHSTTFLRAWNQFIYRIDSSNRVAAVIPVTDYTNMIHVTFYHMNPQQNDARRTVSIINNNVEDDIASVNSMTELWIKTVTSGSSDAPARTAALYAPEAVLWGTLSEQIRDTPEKIRDYFDFFATRPNLQTRNYRPNIRIYGNIAINSGYYTFSWGSGDGKHGPGEVADSRYSFVYKRDPVDRKKWMIIDHHSSVMPVAPLELKPAI